MTKTVRLGYAALVALVGISSSVRGTDKKDQPKKESPSVPQVRFSADAVLELTERYPSGLFYRSGEGLGEVGETTVWLKKNEKRVESLFGSYLYVEVEEASPKGSVPRKGWVFAGRADKDAKRTFEIVANRADSSHVTKQFKVGNKK